MAEETAVATPVDAPAAATPAPASPSAETILADDTNKFSSDQIAEAMEVMKSRKASEVPPVEKNAVNVETPVPETPKPESAKVEPPKEVQVDTSFDDKVAKAVEAKIKELGIVKEEEPKAPVKPVDEFHGFKDAKELQSEYEKDPVGVFNKVVAKQVSDQIKVLEAKINQSLNPVRADLENRTISTHLADAKSQVKEMADPNFMKAFDKAFKDNPNVVQGAIDNGRNPYLDIAKIVRGENVANYEKMAYERGVKETEARLAKASRAVVEGGGKVVVETNEINLDDPKLTSSQIAAYLKTHGKA